MMTNEEKKLYLLDAYALIYRSYYAFINNPRITTTGINTSATFGFFNFLLELLELEKPTHLAVVFDPEGPTFRHEMYPPYKAQRPPMPEDLKKSVPYIKSIIEGLGIKSIVVSGFEADDVIGTLAKRGEKEGFQVYMITPDKDYAQLVSERVFMYKPGRAGNKSEVWGIPEVLDHFGIERVEQVIDILGLMGDTADNVPGCDGVGPKSAATLIYKYGSIEGVYQHIDELKGKQKERLLCCQDTVFLSKELVTINTEVPTDVNAEDLALGEIQDDVLKPIFNELELFSLAKRVFMIEHEENLVETIHPEEVDYREITTVAERDELFQKLKEAPEYVLNVIFGDGTIYNSYPEYLCFSTAVNTACYLRLPSAKDKAEDVIRLFKPILEDQNKVLISNDVKDDIIWLRRAGVEILNKIFDVKIAHYVLQPDSSHELERVALEMLNYRLIKGDNTENPQLSLFPDEGAKKDKDFAERTNFQIGVDFLNRHTFFRMLSFTGSLSYDFQSSWRVFHTITPLKITYTHLLQTSKEFDETMENNPAIAMSFKNQLIPSMSYSYTYDRAATRRNPNRLYWQNTIMSAGNILSAVQYITGNHQGQNKKLFGNIYSQFLKLTSEVIVYRKITETSLLATRFMGGIGCAYGNSRVMPYSEQFYIGGANSIRAFTIRSIGPGSYHQESDNKTAYLDQTGDIKLEGNVELRFKIMYQLNGAIFLDAGNVWLLRNDPKRPGGEFKLAGLLKEIALGTGFGLRYDFGFIVLRGDLGIALHTPYKNPDKSGYYNIPKFKDGLRFHLAIGYPF